MSLLEFGSYENCYIFPFFYKNINSLICYLHILSDCSPRTLKNRISQPNIAIIDDEKDLLFVYKKALELQGLKVVTFNDSSVALNEMKERNKQYCMVIVDIRMPKCRIKEKYHEASSLVEWRQVPDRGRSVHVERNFYE